MMTFVDQALSEAYQRNPILGALLAAYLDGGRVICHGTQVESILNLALDLRFEKVESLTDLRLLQTTAKDLIFCEQVHIDQLWDLSKQTSAQLVEFSDSGRSIAEDTLVDYHCNQQSLRSALMELSGLIAQICKHQPFELTLQGQHENKALFLDRDGVVVDDIDYLSNPDQVKLRMDAVRLIQRARAKNYFVFIVTNQSGLGRAMYSFRQYDQVTARMLSLLAKESVYIDQVLRAPYFEKSMLSLGLVRKSLRKPRPGMIIETRDQYRLQLSESLLVGDCATDLMAGAFAGLKNVYLLHSKRTNDEIKKWKQWPLLSRAVQQTNMQQIQSMDDIKL